MILVTGGNGFVGLALIRRAVKDGLRGIRGAVRQPNSNFPLGVDTTVVPNLASDTDWSVALGGVSVVVHCAARVHVMTDTAADPLEEFRRVNVQGTLNLARQAAAAGVRRFVFVSSIKVNGEATQLRSPFKADDAPAPLDTYGVSKMEAEQSLREIARQTGVEGVAAQAGLHATHRARRACCGAGVTAVILRANSRFNLFWRTL